MNIHILCRLHVYTYIHTDIYEHTCMSVYMYIFPSSFGFLLIKALGGQKKNYTSE